MPKHKTIKEQAQVCLNAVDSKLGSQKLRNSLKRYALKPQQRIICDKVRKQLLDKNYSKKKPDQAKQQRDLAKQGAEAKAKFVESQARFADAVARFNRQRSKYGLQRISKF